MIPDGWHFSWRKFFGLPPNLTVIDRLRRLYVEEAEHAKIFLDHAARMQYPQFRSKLQTVAEAQTQHANWIGETIVQLGGNLPAVPDISTSGVNSWEYLLADLAEQCRAAGELLEQAVQFEHDHPDIAAMLRRINTEEEKLREDIREMLMRSDPQAHQVA
jgi:bacterioferritin (cytochrome b1)